MIKSLKELDALLRGHKLTDRLLSEQGLTLNLGQFLPLAVLLGAVYGFFMGWYSVIGRDDYRQLVASMVKFPALFLITLIVTFPSLYVFNALLGSRLRFMQTLRLLIAAIVVNLAIAASLGPILGFFTFSTTTYSFMVVLNVVLLALSGVVSLGFLMRVLRRISIAQYVQSIPVQTSDAPPSTDESQTDEKASVSIRPDLRAWNSNESFGESKQIFRIWLIIYGLVGAQTGWLLRPFIGSPNLEFTWFRNREGNVLLSIWQQLQSLTSGG